MCFETMDTKSKHLKNSCPRNAAKPGAKSRWRPRRVSTGQDEALKPCRATAMKVTTIRRYLHREQRRTQLAKLTEILGEIGRKEKMESLFKERPAAAYIHRHSPGAMAPENTTQYLMSNVYEDMKTNDIQAVPIPNETHSNLGALDGSPPPKQWGTLLSPAWRRPEERIKRTSALAWPRIVKSRSPQPGQNGSTATGAEHQGGRSTGDRREVDQSEAQTVGEGC